MSYVEKLIEEGQKRSKEFKQHYEEEAQSLHLVRELVELRKKRGLTQSQIAKQLGVTQPRIAEIESGLSGVKAETLFRYARAVGATLTIREIRKH